MDGLLKGLDRLGLGADDGSAVHKPQPIRSDALLMSAIPVPLFDPAFNPPSSLGQVKDKLKDVSDRLENMGRTENSEGCQGCV
jgi:hypothetical protein